MERPILQPIGSPAEELDTPALVVDLGIMEQNIAVLHNGVSGSDAGQVVVRPHVSCHGCPEIAQFQLSAVGNSGGVAVSSLTEAEAFASANEDVSTGDGTGADLPSNRRHTDSRPGGDPRQDQFGWSPWPAGSR